jgi:uncharacterized membrane protein
MASNVSKKTGMRLHAREGRTLRPYGFRQIPGKRNVFFLIFLNAVSFLVVLPSFVANRAVYRSNNTRSEESFVIANTVPITSVYDSMIVTNVSGEPNTWPDRSL